LFEDETHQDAPQEARPVNETLPCVPAAVCVAEEMGAVLGSGAVLQRKMPQSQEGWLNHDYVGNPNNGPDFTTGIAATDPKIAPTNR